MKRRIVLEKLRKESKHNHKGFSLVELIVVIAIMATLFGLFSPAFLQYVEKARTNTCNINMDTYVRAVSYEAQSSVTFQEGLLSAGTDSDSLKTYLSTNCPTEMPVCPNDGEYTFTLVDGNTRISMACSAHSEE